MAMFQVLDPVGDYDKTQTAKKQVNRLADFHGKTLGFLKGRSILIGGANPGTDPFLERLRELMQTQLNWADVIWRMKPSVSHTAPREIAEELASKADAVINGHAS